MCSADATNWAALHRVDGDLRWRSERGKPLNINDKKILVVGDRVLLSPEQGQEKTKVGLYLPQTAIEKMAVQAGRIVDVGPGTPIPAPNEFNDEPWKQHDPKSQYIPMEARAGDLALFLKNAAVEIEFEGEKYLIVPQAGILLLVRDDVAAETDRVPDGY